MANVWRLFTLILVMVGVVTPAMAQQRIQPSDTLRVICVEEPGLNKNYEVTDDGMILVNFLGAVNVKGMTEAEAAATIKKQLEDERILPKATITVSIVRAAIPMVKFEGAVGLEAETPWREGMRLSDIVRLAEPVANTDLSKVTIVSLDGKSSTIDFSIADLQTNVNNPLIKAGDVIKFASKGTTTPPGNPTNPNNPPTNPPTNPNDPPKTRVSITGEVVLNGEFEFQSGMTVQDALVRAGGFTAGAETQQVILKRAGANIFVRLPGQAGFRLMPGDELSVMRKSDTGNPKDPGNTTPPSQPEYDPLPPGAHIVFVNGVRNPGKVMLEPGMTLGDAIKKAGGFARGADKSRIRILSPNNTKPRMVNFRAIELRYKGDILLKPGQTIEIPGASGAGIELVGWQPGLVAWSTFPMLLVSL